MKTRHHASTMPLLLAVVVATLLVGMPDVAHADPNDAIWRAETETGFELRLFATLRFDAAYDSRRLRRLDGVTRVAPRFQNDGPESWMSANASLLGLRADATRLGGTCFSVSLLAALDFHGLADSTNSREAFEPRPRLRLFQAQLCLATWLRLDAGIGPEPFAPLLPPLLDAWRALGSGNVGWDKPHLAFRLGLAITDPPPAAVPTTPPYSDTPLGLVLAIVDPRAGTPHSRDADNQGGDDGRDSGWPALQARLCFGDPRTQLGISAHLGFQRLHLPNAIQRRYTAYSIAFDARVPLVAGLVLSLEVWFGQNTDPVGGGMTLFGIDPDTFQPVDSHGGWIALSWRPPGSDWWLDLTWALDDPSNRDLYLNQGSSQIGGTDRSQVIAATLTWWFAPNVALALEIEWWKVEFFSTFHNEAVRSMLSLRVNV